MDSTDMLTFSSILWEKDIIEFVKDLGDLNITEIRIADESTALMRALHLFDEFGFKFKELTTYEDKWGDEKQAIVLQRKA